MSNSLDPGLSGLIWVQTICKGYQRANFVATNGERIKRNCIPFVYFFAIFTWETKSVISCLLSCTQCPCRRGVYSKRKELAPLGQILSFNSRTFFEGQQNSLYRVTFPESISNLLKFLFYLPSILVFCTTVLPFFPILLT